MENNGTAILLKVQSSGGGDLVLIVDYGEKKVSLVEVDKSALLHVKEVHEYLKPAYIKPRRRRK
jgi:hypothetical protein